MRRLIVCYKALESIRKTAHTFLRLQKVLVNWRRWIFVSWLLMYLVWINLYIFLWILNIKRQEIRLLSFSIVCRNSLFDLLIKAVISQSLIIKLLTFKLNWLTHVIIKDVVNRWIVIVFYDELARALVISQVAVCLHILNFAFAVDINHERSSMFYLAFDSDWTAHLFYYTLANWQAQACSSRISIWVLFKLAKVYE